MKYVEAVVMALLHNEAHKATKYISENEVISATRRLFQGKIRHRENVDVVLKIGKPNYAERKFIKSCKKAGEPLPVKKILLKLSPKRKAA